MQDLIKIHQSSINDEIVYVVRARELCAFLGVDTKNISKWIDSNITNNPFAIQGVDFIEVVGATNTNNVAIKEYDLAIEFAKRLSMMSRTTKGEEARQYFIECEKIAKKAVALPDFTDPAEAAIAWANEYKAKQVAQEALAIAQPKAQAYDVIATASVGHMNITDASKVLKMQPKKLFSFLEGEGWIYKRGGKGSWVGKQSAIDTGYVTMIATTVENTGEPVLRKSVHLTDKGIAKISAMLIKANKLLN